MKTKPTELREACRCVDAAVSSSILDVVALTFGRVSDVVAASTSSNDVLRRITAVSELQIE